MYYFKCVSISKKQKYIYPNASLLISDLKGIKDLEVFKTFLEQKIINKSVTMRLQMGQSSASKFHRHWTGVAL